MEHYDRERRRSGEVLGRTYRGNRAANSGAYVSTPFDARTSILAKKYGEGHPNPPSREEARSARHFHLPREVGLPLPTEQDQLYHQKSRGLAADAPRYSVHTGRATGFPARRVLRPAEAFFSQSKEERQEEESQQ